MGAEHASRLALDQALVGAASTEVTSHLAGCATCQARIKALRDADQRFLAHTSPAAEVRGLEPRARSWPLICALGAVLGTAAVALIALRPPVERERAKGASVVTLLHRDTLQPLGGNGHSDPGCREARRSRRERRCWCGTLPATRTSCWSAWKVRAARRRSSATRSSGA